MFVCVYIYIKADLHSGNESCTTSAVAQDHVFTSIRILIECSAVELHKIDEKDVMENSYGMF